MGHTVLEMNYGNDDDDDDAGEYECISHIKCSKHSKLFVQYFDNSSLQGISHMFDSDNFDMSKRYIEYFSYVLTKNYTYLLFL